MLNLKNFVNFSTKTLFGSSCVLRSRLNTVRAITSMVNAAPTLQIRYTYPSYVSVAVTAERYVIALNYREHIEALGYLRLFFNHTNLQLTQVYMQSISSGRFAKGSHKIRFSSKSTP